MSARISDTGERGFIEALRKEFPMALAGDDAAVLKSLSAPVVTTDSFFEGTHFHRWWTTAEKTAERLLEATLSDLAAMGCPPGYLFSSLMLPPDMEVRWIMDFYRGLTARPDCSLAGGETVRGPVFGVTLTAIGDCGESAPLLRSAARPGDSLWVTGPLGRSLDSPELLERSRERGLTAEETEQIRLFLEPRARFDAVHGIIAAGGKAAIDISDGLFSECRHIMEESGVGVSLDLDRVPLVPYCSGRPLEACSAGEDFELLFTLPHGAEVHGAVMIGGVTGEEDLKVLADGKKLNPGKGGYDHFF